MEQVKKILIPTDFSVKSLNLVRKALENTEADFVEIILVNAILLSDSISDLLFFSKTKLIRSLETKVFTDACQLIKNKHQSKLLALDLDLIISDNRRYFDNYLQHNMIDEIYILSNYSLELPHKLSFDPMRLFTNCRVTVTTIDWHQEVETRWIKTNQVSDLFCSETTKEWI